MRTKEGTRTIRKNEKKQKKSITKKKKDKFLLLS